MYLQHALTDPNMVHYDSNTNPPMQKTLSENLCPLKPRQIFNVKSLKIFALLCHLFLTCTSYIIKRVLLARTHLNFMLVSCLHAGSHVLRITGKLDRRFCSGREQTFPAFRQAGKKYNKCTSEMSNSASLWYYCSCALKWNFGRPKEFFRFLYRPCFTYSQECTRVEICLQRHREFAELCIYVIWNLMFQDFRSSIVNSYTKNRTHTTSF